MANIRIQNKSDKQVNWEKAINFVPLKGEIIIYEKDENYLYDRIKLGNGITKVNDLPFIDEHMLTQMVGKTTNAEGEIFNDYENNQALSLNSHAQGENTNAGTKAFKIASSFTNNGSGTIKFNLNSSEGLNDNLIGTPCTLRVANEFSNGITISGYDTTASTITLKGVPADATYETDSDDANTHTVENFIVIQGHPELGDIDVGHNAHAGGYNTLAQGRETFAAGRDNKVVGQYGAVTGRENIVGHGAFASGRKNTALGIMSHAEGSETKAIGSCAHAEGKNTESYGTYSHAEGSYTKAHGDFTHSEGYRSTASGETSHAEGGDTTAEGNYSHAEGYSSYAKGINTHSEGNNTYAEGSASHAEGTNSQSVGQSSHAEGRGTLANGTNSHSEGNSTEARGNHSHAEGVKSRTGNADNTGGYAAHAEGNETEATGSSSHSEGNQTHATASCSHAEGNNTYASGSASHAEGAYTIAASAYQHVQGKYNVVDSEGTYAHIIGNGTGNADDQRKNIHTVDWDGNAWFAGEITVGADKKKLVTEDDLKNLDGAVSSVNGQTGEVNLTINDIDNRLTIDDISFQYNDSNGSFKAGYEGVFANGDVNGGYNFSVDCFGLNYSGSPSADHDIVLNQIKWIDENDSSLGTFETTHKLSEKANSKDVYTKDEVDSLIASSGGENVLPSSIIINSSTPGSTKQFKITIDDNGTLTATELEGNE